MTTADLRYPIGPFVPAASVTPEARRSGTATLAQLPEALRNATTGLDPAQLDTPYRPDGWTVRQLVHHIADSHMHAFLRIRLALTEDVPTIKPYDEQATANLHDTAASPIGWSVDLLAGLHARWVMLLESLDEAQWQRTFRHPERGTLTIEQTLQLYAWHSHHHTAHITHLRDRMKW